MSDAWGVSWGGAWGVSWAAGTPSPEVDRVGYLERPPRRRKRLVARHDDPAPARPGVMVAQCRLLHVVPDYRHAAPCPAGTAVVRTQAARWKAWDGAGRASRSQGVVLLARVRAWDAPAPARAFATPDGLQHYRARYTPAVPVRPLANSRMLRRRREETRLLGLPLDDHDLLGAP